MYTVDSSFILINEVFFSSIFITEYCYSFAVFELDQYNDKKIVRWNLEW